MKNTYVRVIFIQLLISVMCYVSFIGNVLAKNNSEVPVPIQENLGGHSYAVSTSIPMAQRYFDQGLILAYGFNHAEAARSFVEASRIDPACAMCFWGEALVLGPNINAPMDASAVPQAYAAAQQALALSEKATGKEQALIQAVARRYAKDVGEDRSHLDAAYADAMRTVAKQFPDDAVIGALLAEALMDVHPWDLWTTQGEAKPWTLEIIRTLEVALQHAPNNPLANHLYIHTMEASPYPEKALPSAKRLATLVPGSGHLVHMPGHIYIRIGRYRDVVHANQHAVAVDQEYLKHSHAEGIYTAAYVPHNHHFLWAAATKTGQQSLAMQAANDTAAKVNPEAMRDPTFAGTLQHFWLMPLYTQALFGQWAEILQASAPPEDLVYPTAIWHYARGLAFVRQGKADQAQQELSALRQRAQDPAVASLTIFDINPISTILSIAENVLLGEIEAAGGRSDVAVTHLEKAVNLEDTLNYTEPKDWYLPPRQVLGAVLLQAGKAAEAEQVYRTDLTYHPQSGWSLFGLVQSLHAQGHVDQANVVQQEFDKAWVDAEVMLTSSRF
ncbi:tetratricopeptide repeat protein [Nitrospira sp. M1]